MPHPQRIGLHLTDRCQLDCAHCLRDPAQQPTDLELGTIRGLLREAGDSFGIRWFSLTGGEPTLHPFFPEILDAIAASSATWDMVTNGERFERVLGWLDAHPARRQALRSITFSLDGDASTHDSIRGPGSYETVLRAISLAAVADLPFGVQMAVHARNFRQIESVGLLAAQLGAKHVSFPMTQPSGTAHDAELFLPAGEWRRVQDRVASLGRALSITVVLPEGYPTEQPLSLCSALRTETLHVDVHGRLTLCCQHSDIPSLDEAEVAAPVADGFTAAYRILLDLIHRTTIARLDAVERGGAGPWAAFGCNECLKSFGKPHWTNHGAAGPAARRERWRGAANARSRLPVVG